MEVVAGIHSSAIDQLIFTIYPTKVFGLLLRQLIPSNLQRSRVLPSQVMHCESLPSLILIKAYTEESIPTTLSRYHAEYRPRFRLSHS